MIKNYFNVFTPCTLLSQLFFLWKFLFDVFLSSYFVSLVLKVIMTGSQGAEVEEVVNVEVHQAAVVEEISSRKRFVNLTVSLSQAELPRVDRCCFFFDLRWGLNVWLAIESLIWIFLFFAALCYEIIFIESDDLLSFYDETQQWYFHLVFGDRLEVLDHKTRSKFKIFITWWHKIFF